VVSRKMKRPLKIILVVLSILVLGVGLGVGSAALGLYSVYRVGSISNGAWTTSLATGSEKADPYNRALVAVGGLLALNPSEVMYYSADKDSNGNPLNADCTYKVEGKAPDARWWSVTVYGADGYLIPDTERYSYSLTDLTPDSNGVYTIYLSKSRHSGAWLSLGNEKTFNLSLRLYNPWQSVRSNAGTVELLRVIKEDCK
jgi:hypothetical protein